MEKGCLLALTFILLAYPLPPRTPFTILVKNAATRSYLKSVHINVLSGTYCSDLSSSPWLLLSRVSYTHQHKMSNVTYLESPFYDLSDILAGVIHSTLLSLLL